MFAPYKLGVVVGVLGMFALAGPAAAQVGGTAHDLSGDSYGTTEQCIFCHTPHNGGAGAPLWNHSLSAVTTYDMYDNTVSSTIDMTVDATPGAVSLACLGCHDGTIGVDDYGTNLPTPVLMGTLDPTRVVGTVLTGNNDLSGQHPIAVTYDSAVDTAFNPKSGDVVGILPLYSGKVECGTCHDPHSQVTTSFLRVNNTNSDLCTTCHIK